MPRGTIVLPDTDFPAEDVSHALDVLVLRRFVKLEGGRYSIVDRDIASYYANSLTPHIGALRSKRIHEFRSDGETRKT